MGRHVVDIAEVQKALAFLASINTRPLRDLIFVDGDKQIPQPTASQVSEWRFIGLDNVSFIEMRDGSKWPEVENLTP